MLKDLQNLCDLSINDPSRWDIEQFKANWFIFLEKLIEEEASSLIPSKRIRCQIEQTRTFRQIVAGWESMRSPDRLDAWKSLLVAAEEACSRILPGCVQCGECCRAGSPTLHLEDLPVLRAGKIPWDRLITLRKAEPARSPFDGRPFVLPEERIKIREKEGLRECVFLVSETSLCSIYADRPIQCRAQACWDPIPARDAAELPFLFRKHVFEGVDVLLEIIAEHEGRFGFEAFAAAFEQMGGMNRESIQKVLGLLSYEDHFRQFVGENFKIPPENMELLLGRSFTQMTALFGFKVYEEPDGTRCLAMENRTECERGKK